MPFFLTQRETGFFDQKANTSTWRDELPPNRLVEDTGDPQADSVWIHVAQFLDGVRGGTGWVERASLVEVPDAALPRPALSLDTFVAECVSRSWTANLLKDMAPFYVDPDYLLALASIQSGFTNPAGVGPKKTRVGPFGISAEEWQAFMAAPFDGYQYKDYELQLPLFQVAGAAYQMHSDAKAISAEWQKKGVGTVEDPYLPRFGELLRCRLIGVGATVALQAKLKNQEGGQMLPDFLKEQGLADADVAALMTDRKRFMRTDGSDTGDPFSLQAFSDKCNEIL